MKNADSSGLPPQTGPVTSDLPGPEQIQQLRAIAGWVRRAALRRAYATGQGHLGSEFSVTEILVALLCSVMRVSRPTSSPNLDADRLILSKGHAAVALYATLVAAGLLDESRFWARGEDILPSHPVAGVVPGVDATTGSLGHGLSLGVGMALAAQRNGSYSRTFVVVGDGELQEGSNWEALMLAAHLQLGNLIAVIDANGLQQGTWVSATNDLAPLPAKIESFGWQCDVTDGNDLPLLLDTLALPPDPIRPPRAVVARTTKGFGVSFMADAPAWHHRIPDADELARAMVELNG